MTPTAALGIAAVIAVLATAPAHGKGAGMSIDRYVQPGETVDATSALYSRWKDELRDWLGDRPMYAYVSPSKGRRYDPVPPLPEGARRLGRVQIGDFEKAGRWWSVDFGVEFTMPELPPGAYRLDVCTSPCKSTIEGSYPSVFRLVAGPMEERVQRQIDRLDGETQANAYTVRRTARRAESSRREIRAVRTLASEQVAEQKARIDDLQAAVRRLRSASGRGLALPGIALGLAGGFGIALLARPFRKRISSKE